MKKSILSTIFFILLINISFSQSFLGKWKTIDDETGKPKAIIEIFQKGNVYYGKIVELLIKPSNNNCVKCTDDRKNKPIIGLEVLRGMRLDDKELSNGKILDPEKGKEYKCTISFENKDKIKVRGYIGVSLIGRNQYWERYK